MAGAAPVGTGRARVCLVRDQVPQSEFVRGGLHERVTLVRGDLCDQQLLERVLNEHEIVTVLHLAAQAIVGQPTAIRFQPLSEHSRHVGLARSVSPHFNGQADCVASSD
jgi:hypothetical protein